MERFGVWFFTENYFPTTDSKSKPQLYSSQGLKNEDLQTEMLIDRFFEAAWEADDLLDYIGGNPFSVAKVWKFIKKLKKKQILVEQKTKNRVESRRNNRCWNKSPHRAVCGRVIWRWNELRPIRHLDRQRFVFPRGIFSISDKDLQMVAADSLSFQPDFLPSTTKPTPSKPETKEEKNKKYKSFWESMWKVPLGWILGKRIDWCR